MKVYCSNAVISQAIITENWNSPRLLLTYSSDPHSPLPVTVSCKMHLLAVLRTGPIV